MSAEEPTKPSLALAADHGGLALKEALKAALLAKGVALVDLGTHTAESVDYPDLAHRAARGILAGEFPRVILVCGTGVGMAMAANRHPGVRAVNCSDTYTASMSRSHNDSNVLALGERVVGPGLALAIVEAWLSTPHSDDARHHRRVGKIEPA
ncbi:MAG TPA: ribose 5-phosphate isomerase B [Polyangiaceae bacterium]|nr:ribose 5-phosphate isomerase B [Polyangiaceae bacterium]